MSCLYYTSCTISRLIRLDLQLGEFSVLGAPTNGQHPQMVESQVTLEDEKVSEVSLQFETNPMDGKADQRITLRTQPLKVVYDAVGPQATAVM